MGKIIYDPKNVEKEGTSSLKKQVSIITKGKAELESLKSTYDSLIESIDSVRPVGDTECDYVVYVEDYVYTYMYQYAATNLDAEHAGVLVGEFYPETKEMIVCGMLPVPKEYLVNEEEWINFDALEYIKEEKEKYFSGTSIIGWMHMQPGYGTMLTMKEVKIHRDLFDKHGSLLLLMDAVNKIETFYVFEEDTLKEQSGYYIYYDKNPAMQQYMLENPFVVQEKEQVEDGLVNQFREIGRKRKKEYEQRKRLNFTVAASALTLLAMSAVLVKMTDQRSKIQSLENDLAQVQAKEVLVEEEDLHFTIEPTQEVEEVIEVMGDVEEAVLQEEATQINEEIVEKIDSDKEQVQEVVSEQVESTKTQEVVNEVEGQTEQVEQVEQVVQTEQVEPSEYLEYVVKEGDTLLKISYEHYKTESRAKEIIQMNEIENGDAIFVGQKLKLPME